MSDGIVEVLSVVDVWLQSAVMVNVPDGLSALSLGSLDMRQ